ncbi:hypothetical protein MRB53_039334 [Persea americana]|nr:hypothetical protein MRB53_039334 [Persea americana]
MGGTGHGGGYSMCQISHALINSGMVGKHGRTEAKGNHDVLSLTFPTKSIRRSITQHGLQLVSKNEEPILILCTAFHCRILYLHMGWREVDILLDLRNLLSLRYLSGSGRRCELTLLIISRFSISTYIDATLALGSDTGKTRSRLSILILTCEDLSIKTLLSVVAQRHSYSTNTATNESSANDAS